MKKYTHIFWDWNGTLLDDVPHCMEVMNEMLSRRGLPAVSGVENYREIFRFPVIEIYMKVGFDFKAEPFEQLAIEFTELYKQAKSFKLYENAEHVLSRIQETNIHQVILSASEVGSLQKQVSVLGIGKYFDELLGTSNIYGESKVDIAFEYAKRRKVRRGLLIGDTEHDFEVADTLGFDCILIANGHQSCTRIAAFGVPVLDSIRDVLVHIC